MSELLGWAVGWAVGAVVGGLLAGDVIVTGLTLSIGLLIMGRVWPGLLLLAVTVVAGIVAIGL